MQSAVAYTTLALALTLRGCWAKITALPKRRSPLWGFLGNGLYRNMSRDLFLTEVAWWTVLPSQNDL
jgi:hypothetical protein